MSSLIALRRVRSGIDCRRYHFTHVLALSLLLLQAWNITSKMGDSGGVKHTLRTMSTNSRRGSVILTNVLALANLNFECADATDQPFRG
jgi:hypothetical protein